MNPYLSNLVERYRSKGILVDANLLLLLIIGSTDLKLIGSFKRTQTFNVKDFQLLVDFLNLFDTIYTTPHVLTEVGNLASSLKSHQKPGFSQKFKMVATLFLEEHRSFKLLANEDSFSNFGLTDTSLLSLAKNRALLLTDDFPLTQFADSRSIDAINFNHIRIYA